MSSMLKKTGGLAFKPKAGARRGPAASNAAAATSASTAKASSTDSPSRAPVPRPSASKSPAAPPTPATATQAAKPQPPSEATVALNTPSNSQTNQAESIQSTPSATLSRAEKPTQRARRAQEDNSNDAQEAAAPAPGPTPDPTIAEPAPAPETNVSVDKTARPVPRSNSPARPANLTGSATLRDEVVSRTNLPRSSNAHPSPAPTPSEPTTGASQADISADIGQNETTQPPKRKRVYKKRQAPQSEAGAGSETVAESSTPKPKRQYRKRKQPTETAEAEEPAASNTAGQGDEEATSTPAPRRRKRSATPEDAESQQVDHSLLKVGDLTRDLRIGKKFKHADVIAERAREARARQRQKRIEKQKRKLGLIPDDDNDGEGAGSRSGTPAGGQGSGRDFNPLDVSGAMASSGGGVGYEVVDGQIVVNQQSLVVDRHAANQDMSTMVTVEEDEFTHLTTSHSYLRESRNIGSNSWSDEDTEKFYRCLQMFGTDFETISHMFPGKSRRHVKLKFNREERMRPKRVNAAIMVRAPKTVEIDLDEYKNYRKQWQETDKIQQEQDQLAEEHRKEVRRLKAERRAQGLFNESDSEDGNAEATTTKSDKPSTGPGESGEGGADDGTGAGEDNANVARDPDEVYEEVLEENIDSVPARA